MESLLATAGGYLDAEGCDLVGRAADFACRCHSGYARLDGAEYIAHPLCVAAKLAEWFAPAEVVAAGLLHDVLKPRYSHTPHAAAISANFPESVSSLVDDLALLGRFGPALTRSPQPLAPEPPPSFGASNRLSWTTAVLQRNPLAIVVKLADRLHNLETIGTLPEDRRVAFAEAVLGVFAPFADRLGMYAVKRVLQDGAFRIIDPRAYATADDLYQAVLQHEESARVAETLESALADAGIPARVLRQPRHRYSLHQRRLAAKDRPIGVNEAMLLRVLTRSEEDCYRAIQVVHRLLHPLNEVQDFIALPKPNGYRAFHSLVSAPSIGSLHLSLCSEEMYLVAEHGITAAWRGVRSDILPKLPPLPQTPAGHIMVMTPRGEIKILPAGATPVDFAYSVHTEIGHHCLFALVNGRRTTLNSPLRDGDIVDIIAGRGVGGPDPNWLTFVITDAAKQAITRWVRHGKEMEVTVDGRDRIGLVADVSNVISSKGLNMTHFHADGSVDGGMHMRIGLNQVAPDEVGEIEAEIQRVSHVAHVRIAAAESLAMTASGLSPADRSRGNPYSIAPVFGPSLKGRERELDSIVHRLRGQREDNAVLIWGQRRIGKTSILLHLERHVLPATGYLPIFITMHDLGGQPVGMLLHRIAYAIEKKVQHGELTAPSVFRFKRDPVGYFRRFIDRLDDIAKPHSILLMIDEFQGIGNLAQEETTNQEAFACLRSLVQHGLTVSFLFGGGGVPRRMLPQSGLSSLLSVVDHVKIDCLDREGAEGVIRGMDETIEYSEDAVRMLIELTRCHPCYLQFLCRELFEMAGRRGIVQADVETLLAQTMEWPRKLENLVDHFWIMDQQDEALARKNRLVLSAMAASAESSDWARFGVIADRVRTRIREMELHDLLSDLAEYGSIEADDDNYRISIPLFAQWLRAVYPVPRALRMA